MFEEICHKFCIHVLPCVYVCVAYRFFVVASIDTVQFHSIIIIFLFEIENTQKQTDTHLHLAIIAMIDDDQCVDQIDDCCYYIVIVIIIEMKFVVNKNSKKNNFYQQQKMFDLIHDLDVCFWPFSSPFFTIIDQLYNRKKVRLISD